MCDSLGLSAPPGVLPLKLVDAAVPSVMLDLRYRTRSNAGSRSHPQLTCTKLLKHLFCLRSGFAMFWCSSRWFRVDRSWSDAAQSREAQLGVGDVVARRHPFRGRHLQRQVAGAVRIARHIAPPQADYWTERSLGISNQTRKLEPSGNQLAASRTETTPGNSGGSHADSYRHTGVI